MTIRETIAITHLSKEEKEAIKAVLNKKTAINSAKQFQGYLFGLSFVIINIIKSLGIFKLLSKSFESKLAMVLIVARISIQGSRLKALNYLKSIDKIGYLVGLLKDEIASYTYETIPDINDKGVNLLLDSMNIKIPNRLSY